VVTKFETAKEESTVTKLETLVKEMESVNDPRIVDYVEMVTDTLTLTLKFAKEGDLEEIELLVIAVSEFAGQRAQVLQTRRLSVEAKVAALLKKY